jgi:uncharacterized protein
MLGLGIAKVVFTLAVIAIVWHGSKWRMRIRERAKLNRQQREAMKPEPAEMPSERRRRTAPVEDTIVCTSCGAYVPLRGPRSCGRADCPYPG